MPRFGASLRQMALASLMWMALFGAVHAAPEHADDVVAISALMATTWDKPDAKLNVDPIVVESGHAVASWTQGSRGGRALLRKQAGKWKVVLCSGDPLTQAESLEAAGVPRAAAARLARLLKDAESKLLPERVAQFSTFEGLVHIEGDHPGHHH